ncbi:MAG: YdcF family protein [Patescibacteria group bacterium]|nr:YdcF family protein [Patescibacteria group bacterium]
MDVCGAAYEIHEEYDVVLLLGGWDNPSLRAEVTIGTAMRDYLVRLGIPAGKMITAADVVDLSVSRPPCDTAEEVRLLDKFLEKLHSRTVSVLQVCAEPWSGRIKRINRALGVNTDGIIAVKVWLPPAHRLMQRVADALSVVDPLGKGIPGYLFRRTRNKRARALGGEHLRPLIE